MSQTEAITASITTLTPHLRPEHGALVEAARGLAEAVDANTTNASLWKEYRAAIGALLAAAPKADSDNGQTALLELVRPALGNPKNAKAKDARPRPRRDRGAPGPTPDVVAAPGGRRRPRASA